MAVKLDINCDMGESFGRYVLGNDEAVMEWITSANIACGFHAGDPKVMRKTVRLALEHDVAIGAHPGFPDLGGFGRRKMEVTPREVYELTVYQIGALIGFVTAEGGRLQHVKPHGALYNMAARDAALAEAIAEAVARTAPGAILFGRSGSKLIEAGKKVGIPVASEVFSDRTYQKDGSLTPRNVEKATITDQNLALQQVIRMAKEGIVTAVTGEEVPITADTVCIHGDGPHAVTYARKIYQGLQAAGIAVEKVGERFSSLRNQSDASKNSKKRK